MKTDITTGRPPRQDQIAVWVSNLAAPPVLALVGAVLVAQEGMNERTWPWALAFAAAAVVLPSLYVLFEVWRGHIDDIHVPDRAQRFRPFLVALAASLAVWLIFLWWPAPPQFRVLALANSMQTLLFFVITLRWKISLHSAAAGSLTVLGISALSATGLWLALAVPLIAWSRVRLHRHTLAQTICGALLGAIVFGCAFWLA